MIVRNRTARLFEAATARLKSKTFGKHVAHPTTGDVVDEERKSSRSTARPKKPEMKYARPPQAPKPIPLSEVPQTYSAMAHRRAAISANAKRQSSKHAARSRPASSTNLPASGAGSDIPAEYAAKPSGSMPSKVDPPPMQALSLAHTRLLDELLEKEASLLQACEEEADRDFAMQQEASRRDPGGQRDAILSDFQAHRMEHIEKLERALDWAARQQARRKQASS